MTISALMTPDPAPGPFAPRGGVRPSYQGAGLAVTQDATADMGIRVGTGTAFVPASATANAGWVCHNNGTVSRAVTTSSAANPRIDLVIAHVYDSVDAGDVVSQWLLEVIPGTPAASPHPPAMPANAIALAQVAVAKNATSITNANITDVRTQTVALGGVLPCLSTALPVSPYTGQCVFCTDTMLAQVWNGSAWRPLSPASATGQVGTAFKVVATSDASVPGLSVTVPQAATYHVRALVVYLADQDNGVANTFLHYSPTPTGQVAFRFSGNGAGPAVNSIAPPGKPGGGGPVMANGNLYWHEFDGFLTFGAAGTASIQAYCGTSAHTFHVQPGSYLQMTPV